MPSEATAVRLAGLESWCFRAFPLAGSLHAGRLRSLTLVRGSVWVGEGGQKVEVGFGRARCLAFTLSCSRTTLFFWQPDPRAGGWVGMTGGLRFGVGCGVSFPGGQSCLKGARGMRCCIGTSEMEGGG